MRCPACSAPRLVARSRLVRPARVRPRDAHPRRTREVEAAYAIAHARLTIAMGIALYCATRAPRWSTVHHALGELTAALGWRVRTTALSVAPEKAVAHVLRAIDSIDELVTMRAHEPVLASRIERARSAIAAARNALAATAPRQTA
jgi:hypothetical protein